MSIRNFTLIAIIVGLCTTACHESSSEQIRLETPHFDADRFLANVSELASDAYGGRAPMTEGERLTLDFIETQFRVSGLAPLFGDSYRQAVDLISMEVDPGTAHMSFHVPGNEHLVHFADEMVAWTQRVVPEVRVEDSEIVFVGYGIVAPEYGWDDYAGIDMRGKTALILINDPGYASQDPAMFKGNAMTYYGRWTYKLEEAARQGAEAALIIHDTDPASYGWNTVRNSWTGPKFRMGRREADAEPIVLESWIQKDIAEALVEASGMDLSILYELALSPEFEAIELGSTMFASIENTVIRRQSFNVGGLLQGSETPEEAFIYTAHWDHIGTGKSENPLEDVIYNGAVDNATGTAALIELARAFGGLKRKPLRSVAFLAVTAEESGLLGSAWYVENPAFPMPRTAGGINIDGMSVYGPTEDVVVVGYGASELEDLLKDAAELQGRTVDPEPNPERGSFYRSDHFNFARKGVPMLYAKSGWEHREHGRAYLQSRSEEYTRVRYHQPDDEVQDDWDLRGAMADLQLYFEVGLAVADSDAWPQWYKGNEFRAIREKSLR